MHQSGFRYNHSCETVLNVLIDDWISAINNKEIVGTIFLDLTKAFDLVNHALLVKKLSCYNASQSAVNWFKSYLENRYKKVSISGKGKLSESSRISSGVPQGSILGPVLFLLYINDLPLHLQNSTADMFADDTTITVLGKSIQTVQTSLQNELLTTEEWCKSNAMIPNANKTKSMFISSSSRTLNEVKSSNIQLNLSNNVLDYTDSEKLLGVQVDSGLRWKDHVQQTLKKCNSNLYLLLRIKQFLNIHSRKLFYNAYILPHLDYCCTVWGNCSQELTNSILKFQKRAARIILDKDYEYPTEQLFKDLRWTTFSQRVEYKKAILVYKSIQADAPAYLNDKFQFCNTAAQANLRSVDSKALKVPKPSLEIYRKSLAYLGSKIWNELPESVRKVSNLNQFKTSFIRWTFSNKSK